jgi:hypothetical protein
LVGAADCPKGAYDELLPLLIAAIAFTFLRNRLGFAAAVGGKRTPDIDLLFGEVPVGIAADVSLIALVRFNQVSRPRRHSVE